MKWASVLVVLAAGCGVAPLVTDDPVIDAVLNDARVFRSCLGATAVEIAADASPKPSVV